MNGQSHIMRTLVHGTRRNYVSLVESISGRALSHLVGLRSYGCASQGPPQCSMLSSASASDLSSASASDLSSAGARETRPMPSAYLPSAGARETRSTLGTLL